MNPTLSETMLPPLEDLHFDPVAHKYKWDGRWLHLSPTTILSYDLDDFAKKNIQDTKEGPMGWEIRGNTLHACLEHFLTGDAVLDPGAFTKWWEPLAACWLWEDAKVLGVELRMTDKRNMGGSTDFLIQLPTGEIVLGDLKTVSSEKALASRKPATAQLGAYLQMMAKCWPKVCVDKCVTVVAGPGKCRVITDQPQDCWDAWEEVKGRYDAHVDAQGF